MYVSYNQSAYLPCRFQIRRSPSSSELWRQDAISEFPTLRPCHQKESGSSGWLDLIIDFTMYTLNLYADELYFGVALGNLLYYVNVLQASNLTAAPQQFAAMPC